MSSLAYRFTPIRLRDVRAVSRWRYAGIYAFYDPDLALLLQVTLLRAPLRALGLEAFVVRDAADERIGIFNFIRRDESVELGLAMRPDLTGRRLGLAFVEAGMDFARTRYAPRRFTLDVATFNERARRVYERAGFLPAGTFTRPGRHGPTELLAMYRPA